MRAGASLVAGLLSVVTAGMPGTGQAHVTGLTYADIAVQDRGVTMALRIPARGLAEHLQYPLGETTSAADLVGALGTRIAGLFAGTVQVLNAGRPCPADPARVRPDPEADRVRVELDFACAEPVGDVSLHLYVFNELGPDHSILARITQGGRTREFAFRQARADFRTRGSEAGILAQAASFLVLGIEHIFTGYDHVLFVVGLLVIWRGALSVFKVVTAFTLAHSVTLALGALGLVVLPSRLVEAVIALSIAYVGIENIFVRDLARRWRVAFLFGLAHGFGFAGVLQEIGLPTEGLALSLFSFNVGVEIGQLAIVAVLAPLAWYAGRQAYGAVVVRGTSAAIVLMGLVWFVQRALLGA
jgi:hypothetical protein